jgi:hypothetical protein
LTGNKEYKKRSKSLRDYTSFIARVRANRAKGMTLDKVVGLAPSDRSGLPPRTNS